jgi:hypothetical protein
VVGRWRGNREIVRFALDVSEQSLSGSVRVERATGGVRATNVRPDRGGSRTARDDEHVADLLRELGDCSPAWVCEDDGVPDAHADEDVATEGLPQLGHELVIE